jgi:polyhydroxyalkanoate synthesis regulator phasin
MVRNRFFPLLAIAAIVIVSVWGAITYRTVFAQGTTPTSTPIAPGTPGNGSAPAGKGMQGMRGGPMVGGYTDQNLADVLGITVDKLQAAYKTATDEALKEAVSKGLITQEQADQFAKRNSNGRMPPFGGKDASNTVNYNALLAKELGISTDQLTAAYQKATSTHLDNAVKDGTLTQAQADLIKGREALANDSKFQATLKSSYEAAVQQAVTDGTITQAQADQILKEQTNAPGGFGLPGMKGLGGFGGGGHGFGGPRGGGPANNGDNQSLPAPATPDSNGL